MSSELLPKVRNEIESLHDFFVGWFSGRLEKDAFETDFQSRLSEDFLLIPPGGERLSLGELSRKLQGAYGSNPDFRIEIRAVQILRVFDGHLLATYEEWQRNALASKPADNGRISTVLFRNEKSLRWLHVHETWLPKSVMEAGPYDF